MKQKENRIQNINSATPSEIVQYLTYGDRIEIPLNNLEAVLKQLDQSKYTFIAVAVHNGKCSLMLSEIIEK